MTDAFGRVTFYEYDGKNRLERVTANQGLPDEHVTTYTYWPDDLLKTITAPNGTVTSYGYDLADRVGVPVTRSGRESDSPPHPPPPPTVSLRLGRTRRWARVAAAAGSCTRPSLPGADPPRLRLHLRRDWL